MSRRCRAPDLPSNARLPKDRRAARARTPKHPLATQSSPWTAAVLAAGHEVETCSAGLTSSTADGSARAGGQPEAPAHGSVGLEPAGAGAVVQGGVGGAPEHRLHADRAVRPVLRPAAEVAPEH